MTRFKSEAAFARHAGVAPIPVWSGNTAGWVRMSGSGNRQLKAALHRIAVTRLASRDWATSTTANESPPAPPKPRHYVASNATSPASSTTTTQTTET